ncbi:hypothetical protein [Aquitalea sp. ASV15]|uniref:hypothetical protein n=1 Tax=Aquitalea sp. ASV15 TaxID=2795104 RepID=UPI0018EDC9F9|nr:hypothetical protein [Aquitalea sp. ASV15]
MIPLLLLGGLLAGAAVVVAVTFWDKIKQFLKSAFEKVKQVISATIVGVAAFVESNNWREGVKAFYKFYSKDKNGMWQETVTTKTIAAEDVPENIRRKGEITNMPVDISQTLELELA